VSIIAPQIEAYLFVDLPGTRKIEIKDSGAVTVSLTLSATAPLSEALQDWQDQANAHPSLNGTYSFGWIPAEQKVRFVATENFDLDLFGSLPEALGFSVSGWSGAQNYGSDLTPKIVCNPINIDYTPPRVAEESELRQYSWGRVSSHTHYKARVSRVSVVMRTEQADEVLRGPLLAGRARYYPCGYPRQGAPRAQRQPDRDRAGRHGLRLRRRSGHRLGPHRRCAPVPLGDLLGDQARGGPLRVQRVPATGLRRPAGLRR
jgi:hypothetical protein